MIKRFSRNILSVFILLLFTSQNIGPSTSESGAFYSSYRDIQSLYTFFERSIFYLNKNIDDSDLLSFYDEIEGYYQDKTNLITSTLKLTVDKKGMFKELESLYDELKVLGIEKVGNKYVRKNIASFLNEVDPLLGTKLSGDALKHNLNLETVYQILKREVLKSESTLESFKTELENGKLELVNYFPDHLRKRFEEDRKKLKEEAQNTRKKLDVTYVNYMLILKKLKPALGELLDEDKIGIGFKDELIQAYVKTVSQDYLIEIAVAFISDNDNQELLSTLLGSQKEARLIKEMVLRWNEYKTLPTALKQRLNSTKEEYYNALVLYKRSMNQEFFQLREELVNTVSNLLKNTFQKLQQDLGKTIKEQIADSELGQQAGKYIHRGPEKSLTGGTFIDIKNKANTKAWLRMKIPKSDSDRLKKEGLAENVQGEFFLVFKPVTNVPDNLEVKTDGFVFKNNEVGIPKIDKDQVRTAMKDLFVELPLGLNVNNIKLEKGTVGNKINLVTYDEGVQQLHPLNFSLKERGMWARFGLDQAKINAFEERLNLPKGLSLNIKDIELLIDSNQEVDLQFVLSWRLPERFGQLISETLPKEDNEIELKLSEIEDLSINENNIKRAIRNKLVAQIVFKLDEQVVPIQNTLNQNLKIGTFSDLSFSQYENNVRGKMSLLPVGADFLEIINPIPFQFEISFLDGSPKLNVISPTFASLGIEKKLKKKIKEFLSGLSFVQEGEQTLRNLMDGLNINEIKWSPLAKGICIDMDFQFYQISPVPFNFCIGPDAENLDALLNRFESVVLDNAEALAKNYLEGLVSDIDCTDGMPGQVNIFGLSLTVDVNQSSCDRLVASLGLNGGNSIRVVLERNGTDLELNEFDATQLIEQVSTSVENTLNQLGILQFSNVQYKDKRISLDIAMDLRNYGLTLVEDLGSIEIDVKGKIYLDKIDHPLFSNFDGYLKDIGNNMIQALAEVIETMVNDHIRENSADYAISFSGQKIQLTQLNLDLPANELQVYADFLLNNGKIPLPTIITFSLSPFNLRSIELQNDAESILQSGINAGANFLAGLICGPCLKIDPIDFDPNDWYRPIAITGDLELRIPDLFSLPALKFQLSQDGLDFDLKPRIPFPAPIPVGTTGFVLIGTFVEVDLEDRDLTLGTSLTVGASAEAYETAKVGRFDMTATINFQELTRVDFTGDLMIANMALVYGGGFLDLKETEFEFYQKTPLFLKDIINYNTLIQVKGKEKQAIANAYIGILGMEANLEADIKIRDLYAELEARGRVRLPLYEFSGSLYSKFIPALPQSHILTSEASLYGAFDVGGFDISSAQIDANIHRADIRFSFLGARLSATVPMLDAIDDDLILDLLFGMFDFDPEMLADFISNLDETTISLENIDISLGIPGLDFGDGIGLGDGGDDDGFTGGAEGGEGTKMTSEVGVDNGLAGGLPTNHSPFIYSSSRVDSYIIETHRRCKKFKLGPFKVTWSCSNYHVKKDIFKPSNWPGYFKTLPSNFRSYHAIHDNKNDSRTGKRMYDLYSSTVHSFINGYGSDFFLRAPIELEQRMINNQYYLCASKEGFVGGESEKYCVPIKSQLSQEVLNQVKLYGNISYRNGNSPMRLWTSVGFHPEDGVNYLTNPDSVTIDVDRSLFTSSGEYGFLAFQDFQYIPFNPQSQYRPDRINLKGEPLQVYEVKKKRDKKFLQGRRKRTSLDSAYIVDVANENIQALLANQPKLYDVLLTQYAETFDNKVVEEIEPVTNDTTLIIEDLRDFQEYAKSILIDPDYELNTQLVVLDSGIIAFDSETSIQQTKGRDNSNSPLGQLRQAVYNLSNKILINIPVNQQQPLVAILKNKFPNGGDNAPSLLNTLRSNQSDFPVVANALIEFAQNWVYYGRSAELILVNKKRPEDYSFSAWNTSATTQTKNWEFSYVVQTTEDAFDYNKVKLKNSDLANALNLVNTDIDQHSTWINQQGHVYYNLVQQEFKKTLKNKVLLSAKRDSIVYANMDKSNGFSISILTANNLTVRDNLQIYLVNDNVRGNPYYYPYQFRNHDRFFTKITSAIAYKPNAEAYIKKVILNGEDIFMGVIYNDAEIRLFWERPKSENDEITFELIPRDYKQMLTLVESNKNELTKRLGARVAGQSNKEKIAELIFSGLEGFDYWRRYKGNQINPLSILQQN